MTETDPSFAIFRTGSTRTRGAIPDGPVLLSPVGNRPAQLLTYAYRPTNTTTYGAFPTLISRLTSPLAKSISASEFVRLSDAKSVLPSAEIAKPAGTELPLCLARFGGSSIGFAASSLPSFDTFKTTMPPFMVDAYTRLPFGANTMPLKLAPLIATRLTIFSVARSTSCASFTFRTASHLPLGD